MRRPGRCWDHAATVLPRPLLPGRAHQAWAAPFCCLVAASIRYSEALGWAAELHRRHPRSRRCEELLSPLPRALAVSVRLWEEAEDEDLAIAALLPEALAASGQSHRAVGERFGERVADLAVALRPFVQPLLPAGLAPTPQAWVQAARQRLQAIPTQPPPLVLLLSAQLAQQAQETWQRCQQQPARWRQLPAGIEGVAWYWLRLQQRLRQVIPGGLALERLSALLQQLLNSPAYRGTVPMGMAAAVWAARFDDRCLRQQPWPEWAGSGAAAPASGQGLRSGHQ